MRFHIALVNGTRIHFSSIEPIFDQQESTFLYVYNRNKPSFNLGTEDREVDIESALRLLTYLRETVCDDGLQIRNILNRQSRKFNLSLKAALPHLPNQAVKARPFKTKFTPRLKRPRYNLLAKGEWLKLFIALTF